MVTPMWAAALLSVLVATIAACACMGAFGAAVGEPYGTVGEYQSAWMRCVLHAGSRLAPIAVFLVLIVAAATWRDRLAKITANVCFLAVVPLALPITVLCTGFWIDCAASSIAYTNRPAWLAEGRIVFMALGITSCALVCTVPVGYVVLIVVHTHRLRARIASVQASCDGCGYSRAGLASVLCPECGCSWKGM